jgi:hypothetical protein
MSEHEPDFNHDPELIGQAVDTAPESPPMPAVTGVSAVAFAGGLTPMAPRKQSAWGLWWLCLVTLGIYYYVWYHRINSELSWILNEPLPANGNWWNQLIPFWNLVGLSATAKRLSAAHAKVGSPTRVSPVTTWLWAPAWFASQTRYLQRRINILHDVLAAKAIVP